MDGLTETRNEGVDSPELSAPESRHRTFRALHELSEFIRELEQRNPYAVPEGPSADREPYLLSDRIASAATGAIDVDSALGELRSNRGFVLTAFDRSRLSDLLRNLEQAMASDGSAD